MCGGSTGRARVLGVLLASPRAHARSTDDALTRMPPPETGAAAPKAAQEDAAAYRDEFELMEEEATDAEMNREQEKKAVPGHPVRRSLGTYAFDSEVCSYLEVSGTDQSDGTYERMTSYCDGEPYYFCNDCSSSLYIWYEPSYPAGWLIGDYGCGSTYADSWATYSSSHDDPSDVGTWKNYNNGGWVSDYGISVECKYDCSNVVYTSRVADGFCDSSNNVAPCYDGGDCCAETCLDTSYSCSSFSCLNPTLADIPCPYVVVSGTSHQSAYHGTYEQSGSCDGHPHWKCDDCGGVDDKYIWYRSAYSKWYFGNDVSSGSRGIEIYDPDEDLTAVSGTWSEWTGSEWQTNSAISVVCTTPRPTPRPTQRPTPRPTPRPTQRPTPRPTPRPTLPQKTPRPTTRPSGPTRDPTREPTYRPTQNPTRTTTADPSPRPTFASTPRPTFAPTVNTCGELVPVVFDECPDDPDLATCDVVACGELCEGDGECGTDSYLNNCDGPSATGYDVYRKYCGTVTLAPTADPTGPTPTPTAACLDVVVYGSNDQVHLHGTYQQTSTCYGLPLYTCSDCSVSDAQISYYESHSVWLIGDGLGLSCGTGSGGIFIDDPDKDLAGVSGTWSEWTGSEWRTNSDISVTCALGATVPDLTPGRTAASLGGGGDGAAPATASTSFGATVVVFIVLALSTIGFAGYVLCLKSREYGKDQDEFYSTLYLFSAAVFDVYADIYVAFTAIQIKGTVQVIGIFMIIWLIVVVCFNGYLLNKIRPLIDSVPMTQQHHDFARHKDGRRFDEAHQGVHLLLVFMTFTSAELIAAFPWEDAKTNGFPKGNVEFCGFWDGSVEDWAERAGWLEDLPQAVLQLAVIIITERSAEEDHLEVAQIVFCITVTIGAMAVRFFLRRFRKRAAKPPAKPSAPPASNVKPDVKWYWAEFPGRGCLAPGASRPQGFKSPCWVPYDDTTAASLEAGFVTRGAVSFGEYEVDVQTMKQKNRRTGFERDVLREMLPSTAAQNSGRQDSGLMVPPNYWATTNDPAVTKKFDLRRESDEYKRVRDAFMLTLDPNDITIESITRIQNMKLWELFFAMRHSICSPDRSAAEARNYVRNYLFHGCPSHVVPQIVQQGFNRSFCGANATVYGEGVYFARDASYSTYPLYSKPDAQGIQSCFLVRAVVGEWCKANQNDITPGVRDAANNICYDSTVDDPQNPNIFVLYHDALTYPEYIVRFRQTWDPNNPKPHPTTGKPAHRLYRPNVFSDCYD